MTDVSAWKIVLAVVLVLSVPCCTTSFDRSLLERDGGLAGPDDGGGLGEDGADVRDAESRRPDVGSVAISTSFVAVIDKGGALYTRGTNEYAQLGVAPHKDSAAHVAVGVGYRAVAVGGNATPHACAIRDDHSLECWGRNGDGECGVPNSTPLVYPPVRVGSEHDWTALSVGRAFSCGLREEGLLFCWGWAGGGRLGRTGIEGSSDPLQVTARGGWKTVALGDDFACAIDSVDAIECWGASDAGQLGGASSSLGPSPIAAAPGFRMVAVGDDHACGVRVTGELVCWGDNAGHRLGIAASGVSPPVQIGADSDWVHVACGATHTCGAKRSGEIFCWGSGPRGQLGLVDVTSATSPTRVGTLHDWVDVRAADQGTCAIASPGQIYCWGDNGYGQIAPASAAFVNAPLLLKFGE